MPIAKASASDNPFKRLLDDLSPDRATAAFTSKDPHNSAKKVRDTFLSYRKQITNIAKILDKFDTAGDATLSQMEKETKLMLGILDQMDKRKYVMADTLQSFIDMLHRTGATISKQVKAGGPVGNAFQENAEKLYNERTLALRFKKLAVEIGQNVGTFIQEHPDKIGLAGGTSLKLLLTSLLGPAAPLVKILDDTIDINKRVGQALNLTRKATTAVVKEAYKLAKNPIERVKEYASAVKEWFEPWMKKNEEDTAKGKKWRAFLRAKLGVIGSGILRMGKALGGLAGSLLAGLAGLGDVVKFMVGGLMNVFKPAMMLLLPGLKLVGAAAAAAVGALAGNGIYQGIKFLDEKVDALLDEFFPNRDKRSWQEIADAEDRANPDPLGLKKAGRGIKATVGYASNSDAMVRAAQLTGTDPRLMGMIGHAESRFISSAQNPNGSASGLFQFTDETWKGALNQFGKKYGLAADTPKSDAYANSLMYGEVMNQNKEILSRMGVPLTDANLYLAWGLGPTQATKFFKKMMENPRAPVDLPQNVLNANKETYMTQLADGTPRRRTYAEVMGVFQSRLNSGAEYGERLERDSKLTSRPIDGAKFFPKSGRRPDPVNNATPGVGSGQGSGSTAAKLTVDSVPFMPDDNSMMSLNIAGLIG